MQMGFVVNDKKLCVNVLNGRNMPIMDPTGDFSVVFLKL